MKLGKAYKLVILLVIVLLNCYGCSSPLFKKLFGSDVDVKPAQILAMDGIESFEDGDYRDAVKSFQKLKDWYPFSKYAILAELKIADCHFYLEEYMDAFFAYDEFIELHPRNEAIPYVIYQTGRCYFDQLDTIDRDQESARKSLDVFSRLRNDYPDSLYSEKALVHINICLKSLAGHELYVGKFYFKSNHYKAALFRFKKIIIDYPDVGVHQKAMQYIALCEELIEKQK